MLIVLMIIAIVTTIALLGQSTFNQSLMLTNTTYSVALSLREMQSLGLSSKRFTLQGQNVQNPGYGAHFSSTEATSYILFADTRATLGIPSNCPVGEDNTPEEKPGNCLYDTSGSPPDGVVNTFTFSRGFNISDFCGVSSGTLYCAQSGSNRISDLDIAFLRSDTETALNAKRTSGSWLTLTSAAIYIESPDGSNTRAVCVSRVGQISIATSTCPL
jgi:hypothetical protein